MWDVEGGEKHRERRKREECGKSEEQKRIEGKGG